MSKEEPSQVLFWALNSLERAKFAIDKEIDFMAKIYGESLGPKQGQHVEKFTPRIQLPAPIKAEKTEWRPRRKRVHKNEEGKDEKTLEKP